MLQQITCLTTVLIACSFVAQGQESSTSDATHPATPVAGSDGSSMQPESKRFFGLIRADQTFSIGSEFVPLTPGEKFALASKDAFGPAKYAGAAVSAGCGIK